MAATNEQVFVNGKIFTARNEEEFVSAFKVEGGKISWAGDASEVDGYAAPSTCRAGPSSPASSTCTPTPPTWP